MAAEIYPEESHQDINQQMRADEKFTNLDEPHSLSSDTSGNSSLPPSTSASSTGQQEEEDSSQDESIIKCSAIHTLERDMPEFDYSHLIKELRQLVLEDIQENPGFYGQSDRDKCLHDDWHLARFLLRNKLQVFEAFDMLRKASRFNNESLNSSIRSEDFPAEFYQLGGIFGYEPDRKGNKMLYLRVALHRKTPEILTIIQAFIYHNIKKLDDEAKGKGISIVIDCSGGGLANADMDLLLYIIYTLKNYFPKGLSYFLIHELPWILKPFWHIAKTMIPDEHKQLIKFSDSKTIYEYVDRENLPDFMGGTCKRSYREVPDNCTIMEEAAKLWGIDHHTIRKVLVKFQQHLPEETVARIYRHFDECDQAAKDEQLS